MQPPQAATAACTEPRAQPQPSPCTRRLPQTHKLSFSLCGPPSSCRAAKRAFKLSYSGNWMTTCMTPSSEGPRPLQERMDAGAGRHKPGQQTVQVAADSRAHARLQKVAGCSF